MFLFHLPSYFIAFSCTYNVIFDCRSGSEKSSFFFFFFTRGLRRTYLSKQLNCFMMYEFTLAVGCYSTWTRNSQLSQNPNFHHRQQGNPPFYVTPSSYIASTCLVRILLLGMSFLDGFPYHIFKYIMISILFVFFVSAWSVLPSSIFPCRFNCHNNTH